MGFLGRTLGWYRGAATYSKFQQFLSLSKSFVQLLPEAEASRIQLDCALQGAYPIVNR